MKLLDFIRRNSENRASAVELLKAVVSAMGRIEGVVSELAREIRLNSDRQTALFDARFVEIIAALRNDAALFDDRTREIIANMDNLSRLLVQKFDALQHESALAAASSREAALGVANQTERSSAVAREIVEGMNNLSQLLIQKFDALHHESVLTAASSREAALGIANQTERSSGAIREIVEGMNNLSQLLIQKFDALHHESALAAGRSGQAVLGIANQAEYVPGIDKFILVYTMGKVGSTALVLSLRDVNVFARHLQWLTPETQAFFDKQAQPHDVQHLLNRLNVGQCRYALKDTEFASLIKVITVIRSPVEQILSHYFHAIDYFGNYLRTMHGQKVTCSTVSKNILDCVEFYLDHPNLGLPELTKMLCDANWDRVFFYFLVFNYLCWIDREFKPFFPHIDIPNGFTEGYAIAGNALILKFEELSTKGEEAVAAYVQRPHFKLARENVGANKNLGELYQQLLNTIQFPKAFVDGLCDSKYVAQFYTKDERRNMKRRWTKR